MKIFVTGGTGAIGKFLLPGLSEKGHTVYALVRNENRGKLVEAMNAEAIVADVFDKAGLIEAVKKIKPEVIIHQLTALSGASGNFKKFDKEFELTNRFRTEVTDTLIEAARMAGTKRFIAQSFCGWPFERKGSQIKTEEDPLDPNPPAGFSETLKAIRYLEEAVKNIRDFDALALRYGIFYGPGTNLSKEGSIAELIRKHKIPVVGNGEGIWSFTHIKDAAGATVKAVSNGQPGIYNIVDDEPAPVKIWLPYLAEILKTKPPARIPVWLAKFLIGDEGISMMTKIRGGSNAKAKRELSWNPGYPSWRQGFKEEFG